MKKAFILGLLILPTFLFAQIQVSNPTINFNQSAVTNQPLFNLKNYTFQLTSLNFNPKTTFTIYNRNTNLNDLYLIKKDTFFYQKSVYIPNNHNLYSSKIDSFNPHGASDFGSAIIAGLLNTVFIKF